jgi:hypothetical protein
VVKSAREEAKSNAITKPLDHKAMFAYELSRLSDLYVVFLRH